MKKPLCVFLLMTSLMLGLAGCGDSDPGSQIETINALMEKEFPLNDQQRSDVEKLVAEGNEQLKAGNPEQAAAAFKEAIEVLEFAEDAAMFNKSE